MQLAYRQCDIGENYTFYSNFHLQCGKKLWPIPQVQNMCDQFHRCNIVTNSTGPKEVCLRAIVHFAQKLTYR